MCLCVYIQSHTYLGKVKCKWDKNANQGGETYRWVLDNIEFLKDKMNRDEE